MPDSVDRVMGGGNQYNAVFTNKTDNAEMDKMDFIKLMVAQMQNQDFTNPMDDTQMVTQMAQFANMQAMQEMTGYSKSSYAMGLVGKTVTASRFGVGGNLDTTTGVVQKVSLVDNEYVLYINGKRYEMSQIMDVGTTPEAGGSLVNMSGKKLEVEEVNGTSAKIKWEVPTEDETTASQLKYTVYYSKEGPMEKLEDVEKGKIYGVGGQKNYTKEELTDLEPDTTYYVNVVVTDGNGAKTVYQKPLTIKTGASKE